MEVKLEVRTDYVFVTFAGPLSLPKFHQTIHDATDAAVDSGLHRMLVDWSGVDGILSTEQRLEIVEIWIVRVLSKTWETPPKIAVFGNFPAINGLGAAVASNRGINARTFPDEHQALDWLGIDPGTQI